ncbi:MAG: hypothetical protein JXA37_08475 [Chloroflexia bacterium]|nr:hypothetical protein [Chloroflexia bacterium]
MNPDNLMLHLVAAIPDEAKARLLDLVGTAPPPNDETLTQLLDNPDLILEIVNALGKTPTQESWELLEWIAAESDQRKLRKSARSAQHRLRSQGFQPVPRTEEAEEISFPHQVWASIFDLEGKQLLRIMQKAPLGMARYARFVISPGGLEQSFARVDNHHEVEAVIEDEDQHIGHEFIETSLAYAARRVHQAIKRSRRSGQDLPEYALEDIRILEGAEEDPWPEELEAARQAVGVQEALQLLQHPTMRYWRLHPQDLVPYLDRWSQVAKHVPMQIQEGTLNLSRVQAQGKFVEEIIRDLCNDELVGRLVEQLRDQARLFLGQGEAELARTAASCVKALEQEEPTENSFLRAMVDASMSLAIELRQEEEEEEDSPWTRSDGQGGGLWVPRPQVGLEEEGGEDEGDQTRIWLPGQD